MQKSNINKSNVLVLVGLMSTLNLTASASNFEIDDVVTSNVVTAPVTAWEHVSEGNKNLYSAATNLYSAGTNATYTIANLSHDVLKITHGVTAIGIGSYHFTQAFISQDDDQAAESFKLARHNVSSSYKSVKEGISNLPNTAWYIWETAKSVAFGSYDLGYGLYNYGLAGKLAINQLTNDDSQSPVITS